MSSHTQVNARPRRKAKLGQNFLNDANAARRIVDALGPISESTVVEIGPGRGVLTKLLAERASHLIATELDETLAQQLRATFAERKNVEIVNANFLLMNLRELRDSCGQFGKQRMKVVGNIPYYITSDILLRLFEQHECLDTIVLMVQKEVADRVVAQPRSRDYGLLTVTAQLFADVERLFTLPPSAFSPPPQVYSSVLRMRVAPKHAELGVNAPHFLQFARQAFAQKRKTLVNNLRSHYPQQTVKAVMNLMDVREDARAEALSLTELSGIYRGLLKDA